MPSDASPRLETTLTLPTRHLREFATVLARAGFLVMDAGERVMTDEGPDAEARLHVLHLR